MRAFAAIALVAFVLALGAVFHTSTANVSITAGPICPGTMVWDGTSCV